MNLQVVPDFRVVDESRDWIVVDKPAPLIVHPTNSKPEPTLLGGLQQLLSFEIENGACLGIVTRLDRETSGLVLVAKHTDSARKLGGLFERREALKTYQAIVSGWPNDDEWICNQPICRAADLGVTNIWVRQVVDPSGKIAETRFQVKRRFERGGRRFALLSIFPKTGRMHQIRVHLAVSGYPIVGDKIYSGDGAEYLEWMETGWTSLLEKRLLMPRHALHATRLRISLSGEELDWRVELPADMQAFIDGEAIELPNLVTMD